MRSIFTLSQTEDFLLCQDLPKRLCRKQNGNGWRCQNPALPEQTLCMKHYSAFTSQNSGGRRASRSTPVDTKRIETPQASSDIATDDRTFVMSEGEDTPWWTFGSKYCEYHFVRVTRQHLACAVLSATRRNISWRHIA